MESVRLHLSFRRYAERFRSPVRTAHGSWGVREGVVVRLRSESGGCGYGEAAPICWFGTETVDEIVAALGELGEWVSAEQLASVPERLGCLRFALAGALAGVSEATAGASAGDALVPFLPVAALLPAGRAALEVVKARAELGFRTFKWKVGAGEPADERALLDDVIAALPHGGKLRLDANGAWDAREASRWLEYVAERPVEFIEQPCWVARTDGAAARKRVEDVLLGLAEDYPTPLALDEALTGANDVERWLAAGWRGVWVVKPALLGDPAPALARLAAAKADVVFSSALETAVGGHAALRLAFSWKSEKPRALGFGVYPLFGDSVFDGPFASPYFRREDLCGFNPEAVWNALN